MAPSDAFHRIARRTRRRPHDPASRHGAGLCGRYATIAPAGASAALRHRPSQEFRLPSGAVLRPAGPQDAGAARAMHGRCSPETLARRYHGPVGEADRYLAHLLSPRFGHTVAVQAPGGELVALGHLLWDGEETEVALLVEDAWQRRGLGAAMLNHLVALAEREGCESVYAVTQASNAGMISAMLGTGLPLERQLAAGTLVLTARLVPPAVPSRARPASGGRR